jgi:hypothetical protein
MKYFLVTILFFVYFNSLTGQNRSSFSAKNSLIIAVRQKKLFWKHTIASVVFIGLSAATWQLEGFEKQITERI